MPFQIIRNDITKVKADAIVNTANPKVTIGDGVDSAVYKAAGAEKLLQARRKIGELAAGEVGITPAFELDAKYIIHSSGPYWIDGLHKEAETLRLCYDRALELACKHRCKSIAFPLLSTGSYGFSKELGLQIALEAFQTFLLRHEMEIILVVFGETAYRLSGQIFEDVRAYIDDSYVERKIREEYHGSSGPFRRGTFVSYNRVEQTMSCQMPRDVAGDLQEDRCSCSMAPPELDFMQETGTFAEYLQQMINKKGMKNAEVYAAANLTKQYFSKLLKGKVAPSKTKILSLAVALRLNLDETVDFLRMSGYALSPFSATDKVFEYFIKNGIYDIYRIDIMLFDCGLPTLIQD